MKKTTVKKILVSALALILVCACTAAPFAMGFDANFFEKAAKDYANSIEQIVETAGDAYEQNAEQFPDNAQTNPDTAAGDYVENAKDIGSSFLGSISNSTGSYLKSIFSFKR